MPFGCFSCDCDDNGIVTNFEKAYAKKVEKDRVRKNRSPVNRKGDIIQEDIMWIDGKQWYNETIQSKQAFAASQLQNSSQKRMHKKEMRRLQRQARRKRGSIDRNQVPDGVPMIAVPFKRGNVIELKERIQKLRDNVTNEPGKYQIPPEHALLTKLKALRVNVSNLWFEFESGCEIKPLMLQLEQKWEKIDNEMKDEFSNKRIMVPIPDDVSTTVGSDLDTSDLDTVGSQSEDTSTSTRDPEGVLQLNPDVSSSEIENANGLTDSDTESTTFDSKQTVPPLPTLERTVRRLAAEEHGFLFLLLLPILLLAFFVLRRFMNVSGPDKNGMVNDNIPMYESGEETD